MENLPYTSNQGCRPMRPWIDETMAQLDKSQGNELKIGQSTCSKTSIQNFIKYQSHVFISNCTNLTRKHKFSTVSSIRNSCVSVKVSECE